LTKKSSPLPECRAPDAARAHLWAAVSIRSVRRCSVADQHQSPPERPSVERRSAVEPRSRHTSAADLPLVRTRSTFSAFNSGVNERLRRAVSMNVLHGLSPTHPECPSNLGTPRITRCHERSRHETVTESWRGTRYQVCCGPYRGRCEDEASGPWAGTARLHPWWFPP